MATQEDVTESMRAYRMALLDEGLFKAVKEAVKKGGQTALVALALQDVAEAREELAEVHTSIERLRWLFVQHSHNDAGQVVVPAAAAQDELHGPRGEGRLVRALSELREKGEPSHPYVRRILEACEDAARLSPQVPEKGPPA